MAFGDLLHQVYPRAGRLEAVRPAVIGILAPLNPPAGDQFADMARDGGEIQTEDPAHLARAQAGLAGDQGQNVELGPVHLAHRGVPADRPEEVDHRSVESCLHQPSIAPPRGSGKGSYAEPVHDQSVTLASIQSAAQQLEGITQVTPILSSRLLTHRMGVPILLKAEHLQRGGSFKLRGAYTRISRLDPEVRAQGVVAASAGNHAQGVALAASFLGISATVVMPESASIAKVEATRGYGAEVIAFGATIDQSLERAGEIARERGATLVHPFDHADIVTGQGTTGLEILTQVPDVQNVIVCTGGGGFLAGIATAIKSVRPDVRVIGVQAEAAAAYPPSLAAHRPIPLERMATMADGIAVGRPGDVPFALIEKYVDEIRTVSEESIAQALLLLLERSKQVVEPAGAVGVAALLQHGQDLGLSGPTVVTLSGGNIDPLLLLRVIRHGMATVGRYLAINVTIPDRPGSLAALLTQIASLNASVVEVAHERERGDINVDEVDVLVVMETRGAHHCDEIVQSLRASGRPVRLA